MKFKAVVFDLDGTLVNSIDGIALSMNNVLKRHGFRVHSTEAYKALVGHGMKELVRKSVCSQGLSDDILTQFFKEMKEEYSKNWDYRLRVYDGIYDLLKYLYKNNIDFAVNTNKEEDIARRVIKKFFPNLKFSCVAGSSPMIPKKPDPSGARMIAGELGVLTQECVFMGDSEVDVMTAKNAKMYSVGVLWGYRTENDLIQAGAQSIIRRPFELLKILG